MKIKWALGIALIGALLMYVCSRSCSSLTNAPHCIEIKKSVTTATLLYAGIIEPVDVHTITSPVEGTIQRMAFQYGETIKAGQLLFTLTAQKMHTAYKESLLMFLKAKSDFTLAKTAFDESQFLHQQGLISDDEFKAKQANFHTAQLTFLQAKDALGDILTQSGINTQEAYALNIGDINKVAALLHPSTNTSLVNVYAPCAGVILAPSITKDEHAKMTVGQIIKQGDVLAMLSNKEAIHVRIKVDELTVNQLQVGQQVFITGPGFANEELKGILSAIDHQGDMNLNALPEFTVIITVPLTPTQKKIIHFGMSCQANVRLPADLQIHIPITAVHEENGALSVDVYDPRSKKIVRRSIGVDKTTVDTMIVTSGLSEGEWLVIPN